MAAPSTSVLTNFTQADGAVTGFTSPITSDEPNALRVVSNQLARQTAGSSGVWSATSFTQDQEVFMSLPTFGDSSVGPLVRVNGTGATMTGYGVTARTTDLAAWKYTTGTGGPGAGVSVQVGSTVTMTWGDGDLIWVTATGGSPTVLTAYRATAAAPTTWTQVGTFTDSTSPFTGTGKIGVVMYANLARVDDFGGGTISTAAVAAARKPLMRSQAVQRSSTW